MNRTTTTMTTILDSNATTTPGRYVLEEDEVAATVESEAPPPLPDVVFNGTGYYIDGEIEGQYLNEQSVDKNNTKKNFKDFLRQ